MKKVWLYNNNNNNKSGNGGRNKNEKVTFTQNWIPSGGKRKLCKVCDKFYLRKCKWDNNNGNNVHKQRNCDKNKNQDDYKFGFQKNAIWNFEYHVWTKP